MLTNEQIELLAQQIANIVLVRLRPDFDQMFVPQKEVEKQIGRRAMYRAFETGELRRIKNGDRNSKCFVTRESYMSYLNNRKS